MKFESTEYNHEKLPEGQEFNLALEHLKGMGSPVAPVLEAMTDAVRQEFDQAMNKRNLAWHDLANAVDQESLARTISEWVSADAENRRLLINEILGHF